MFDTCLWHNEPRHWSLEKGALHVTTDAKSDFWRETYYGFTRDSGHMFATEWTGDFTASVRVRARYEQLYDQAGMMVRVDEANWVKAGIELSDGAACIGSVLTIGRSDWATSAYAGDPQDFHLRVTVENGVLRLQYSADGLRWPLLRLCPFPKAARYRVGPMCCTPERAGLEVIFSDFRIGPPLGRALHDLT
jgi:regulation of enolase protein 1 (concanavalin A-like superfamily)